MCPLTRKPSTHLSCPVWLAPGPESPHQKGQVAARLPPCEGALLLNRLVQLVLSLLLVRQTLFLLLSQTVIILVVLVNKYPCMSIY